MKKTRAERLAERLLQDREAERQRAAERREENRERRPIRSSFDPFDVTAWRVHAGADPGYIPSTKMRIGPVGFYLPCKSCGKHFESSGMAYCSACMEIPADERRQMGPPVTGRLCEGPGCENFIPANFRVDVKYCSARCSSRAYRERKRLSTDQP